MTVFSDKFLSQKLELAEAHANVNFVNARATIQPHTSAEWMSVKGAYALFDGTESPLTQTFGLSLFEEITHEDLTKIENFFQNHNASVFHEVSPMASPSHMAILHERGYKPIELTTVMYKVLSKDITFPHPKKSGVSIRILCKDEEDIWARTSAQGWSTEIGGFSDFIYQFAFVAANSASAHPFCGEIDGKIISTGMLNIHNDVALLAGASTIPEWRNLGAQNALLNARLNYATARGCTLAMLCASPGSQSQKNAERNGFNIAYTRTKWSLVNPAE
ncbi:MAG: GNAT family N-acetyltransferase [Legionella longbeachae]|nr:GNAT family N-acetyltransferase [Legionella longbeachae]